MYDLIKAKNNMTHNFGKDGSNVKETEYQQKYHKNNNDNPTLPLNMKPKVPKNHGKGF